MGKKKLTKKEIFKRLAHSKRLENFNKEREFWDGLAKDAKETVPEKPPKDNKEKRSKIIYSANFDGLVDLVEWNGECAFLIRNKQTNELEIVSSWIENGQVLNPPPLNKIPYKLPRGQYVLNYAENHSIQDCKEDKELYEQLLAYHRSVSELPDEDYYHLLVAWDFHTYIPEISNYSPILSFFAVAERGKSRTGKGLIYVARRGVRVETVQDAHILRFAHDLNATLFFDCMDLWKEVEKANSRDVILNSFERGMKVPRILYPEKGAFNDTVYYEVFGPTIIATNEQLHNILETRALSITMQVNRKRFDNEITPEASLYLKEQLTAWRAVHLHDDFPSAPKVVGFRFGDIVRPLHQIILKIVPDYEHIFLSLIKRLENERLSDKSETLEAEIVAALMHLQSAQKPDLSNYINHGKVAVKDITDYLNNQRTDREKLTYQLIGRRLKALGFKKGSTADSAAAIYWDESKISQLKLTYGLDKPPETSVTSDLSDPKTDDSDNKDDSSMQLAFFRSIFVEGAKWANES